MFPATKSHGRIDVSGQKPRIGDQPVTKPLADLIEQLEELLFDNFGGDSSYLIMGNGKYVAASTMQLGYIVPGIRNHPEPTIDEIIADRNNRNPEIDFLEGVLRDLVDRKVLKPYDLLCAFHNAMAHGDLIREAHGTVNEVKFAALMSHLSQALKILKDPA